MPVSKRSFILQIGIAIFTLLICALFLSILPREIKRQDFFVIEKGSSLSKISSDLYNSGFFANKNSFKYFFLFFFNGESVKVGTYYLKDVTNIFDLGYRLAYGDFEKVPIKITIKEGTNKFDIADIFESKLPQFNRENFLLQAKEGFLFPDTYFFTIENNETDVLKVFEKTFNQKVASLFTEKKITDEEKIYEVINLASIVEEEASRLADRKMVSGILQNRLRINMALQVDVTFQYINGKNTYELTLKDLKDPSLYNTYVHTGLPPTPISSPGLDSILAVLEPTKNDYLYFLSSKSGVMYYAKTFEEHKRNRQKYL